MVADFHKTLTPIRYSGQILRTIGGGISYAVDHIMKASKGQRLPVILYPLTLIVLYFVSSSNILREQWNKTLKPLTEFVESVFRKSGNKVSTLPESFSKANIQDQSISERLRLKASRIESQNDQRRLEAEASIARDKKVIKAKIVEMIEIEIVEKALEVRDFGVVTSVDLAATVLTEATQIVESVTASVEAGVVSAVSAVTDEVAAIFSPRVREASIASSEIQVVNTASTVADVGSVASFRPIVSAMSELDMKDMAVAAVFILVLGSPILQALHQSI